MPWPLIVVRVADDGSFRHFGVGNQGDSTSAVPMRCPGNVDHVIDAAGDPVEAVLVAAAAVTCEVVAFVGREVSLNEALVIAVDRAHLARPAVGDDQVAGGGAFQHVAFVIDEFRLDAEERPLWPTRV